MTNPHEVDYYLPLYDEEGIIDPEAAYHRAQLAEARDVAIPGIRDDAAAAILHFFPELKSASAADLPDEIRDALAGLGRLIERADPEDRATDQAVEDAVAAIRAQFN